MLTAFLSYIVVIDPDEVAGRGEGIPRDVEPAMAGEELVGVLTGFEGQIIGIKGRNPSKFLILNSQICFLSGGERNYRVLIMKFCI